MRRLLVVAWLCAPGALFALSTNKPPEKMPSLRPPADLIGPTWWEQRGGHVIAAGLLVFVGLSLLVWWLRRPQRVATVAAETLAKQALEALRGRTEDAAVVAAVARNLRRYVQAVLRLPADEWTADELLGAIHRGPPAESGLAERLGAILRECETREFAPVPPPAPPSLAERALDVVCGFERLRQPPPPGGGPSPAQPGPPPLPPAS